MLIISHHVAQQTNYETNYAPKTYYGVLSQQHILPLAETFTSEG